MRRPFFLLAAALMLLAACGASGSDRAASTTSTTDKATTTSTTAATPSSTTTTEDATSTTSTTEAVAPTSTPVGQDLSCQPYLDVVNLYSSFEPIVTGSRDGQLRAQTTWDAAVAELQADGVAAPSALATIAKVTFTVTEDANGVPTEGQLLDAFVTLDAAYAKGCGTADLPTECPPPETLEAEGFTCDSEGNLTPVAGPSGSKVDECPAPETLEAQGYTCDSEGNLTPIG